MLSSHADQDVSLNVVDELMEHFEQKTFVSQSTHDETPTSWVVSAIAHNVRGYLRTRLMCPYRMLFDLTAIDERQRAHRRDQPASDVTVIYHLLPYERNADVRITVALTGSAASLTAVTDLCPPRYECQVWDIFGIIFAGHPHLRRILMPLTCKCHTLRKDHVARATERGSFRVPRDNSGRGTGRTTLQPEQWGSPPQHRDMASEPRHRAM